MLVPMETNRNPNLRRQLRRHPDKGMLAGVAAGLGEYLDVDPIAVRLAFVVLAIVGGIAVPLYLVAWLLVPAAGAAQSLAEEVWHRWA
jgi:phage shock protein PspC (stress-responsive transcriptional regulator)